MGLVAILGALPPHVLLLFVGGCLVVVGAALFIIGRAVFAKSGEPARRLTRLVLAARRPRGHAVVATPGSVDGGDDASGTVQARNLT